MESGWIWLFTRHFPPAAVQAAASVGAGAVNGVAGARISSGGAET